MLDKIFILISLFLVSCGTLNYPQQTNSIAPLVSAGLLEFMRYYPAANSYVNLINGSYQW